MITQEEWRSLCSKAKHEGTFHELKFAIRGFVCKGEFEKGFPTFRRVNTAKGVERWYREYFKENVMPYDT